MSVNCYFHSALNTIILASVSLLPHPVFIFIMKSNSNKLGQFYVPNFPNIWYPKTNKRLTIKYLLAEKQMAVGPAPVKPSEWLNGCSSRSIIRNIKVLSLFFSFIPVNHLFTFSSAQDALRNGTQMHHQHNYYLKELKNTTIFKRNLR